jgi:hypothetical protein
MEKVNKVYNLKECEIVEKYGGLGYNLFKKL